MVIVKATRAKCISDSIFFKHKYITQPTLTTADLIVKAIHDLTNAINGNTDPRNNRRRDTITTLANAPNPGNLLPIQQVADRQPRVQEIHNKPLTIATPQVQQDQPPRVRFNLQANEDIPLHASPAPQLIVALPWPPPILKPSSTTLPKSVTDRVKRWHQEQPTFSQSIAERIAQRQRELASPVLNQDTGKMLEYRQLLRDPKHMAIWT